MEFLLSDCFETVKFDLLLHVSLQHTFIFLMSETGVIHHRKHVQNMNLRDTIFRKDPSILT